MTQTKIEINKGAQVIGSLVIDVKNILGIKRKREYLITPITLGTRHNFAKSLEQVPESIFSTSNFSVQKIDLIISSQYSKDVITGLAYLIENKTNTKPSRLLIDALMQMNQQEFDNVFTLLAQALDTVGFLRSIIEVGGFSLQTEEVVEVKDETKYNK